MKKVAVIGFFIFLATLLVYCYPNGAAAEDGRDGTGAEGNQGACGTCHTSATTDATAIQLDSAGTAVTTYHPGIAYTVKISASNGGTGTYPHFGFQLAAVLATGAGTSTATNAGTWGTTLPTDVQNTTPATSGLHINIIEHSNPIPATTGTGSNGSTYVESIPWTAPASGTGSVLFYGIINEVDNNENPSAYQVATHITITEATVAPTVASVSIAETTGSTTICSGTSVTFTATPTNGGTAPTYQWQVNGTAVSGATSATYTTTTLAAGSDAITCVMTSNLSGVTGSPATSNSITLTVNASVTPSVSISSTATTICSGQSVTFTATPTNGGTTPTYQWKDGGTAISGATNSTYTSTTLTNSEVITCELTSNATCASPATATSNSITITVSGTTVTPSVSIASGSGSTFCSGTSVTFTATPTNGGSTPAYQWENGGTAISGATASTYTSSTLVTGDVISVVLISDAACASPTTANSNNLTLTVNPTVAPSITITSNGGSSLCSAQSNTFTSTIANGGSTPAYQWFKNGVVISGATSSTYTTNTLVNGDAITCQLTSDAPCASITDVTSNRITISIVSNATPAVSISSSGGSNICSTESVTFTATPTNGGTTPTYQWYNGSNTISGATAATYTSSTLTNGEMVWCKMVSNSQCVTTADAISDTITMSISANVAPVVTIASGSGSVICSGVDVTFTATPTNGGSSPRYQWFNSGTAISGATAATYTSSILTTGAVITTVLTSSLTCATPTTDTSNAINITVAAGDTASVSITSSLGTTICAGQTSTLTAVPVNGGSSPLYQWMLNGNDIPGATASTYTPTNINNGDSFTVALTSSVSCITQQVVFANAVGFTTTEGGQPAVTIASDLGIDVCAGTSVTFNAVSINEGSSPTYQWTKNGADVGGNISTYTDNNLANGDIIACSITSSLSCAVPDTASSNSLGMTVYPNPVATISDSASVLVATTASSYQWYINNIAVSNGNGRTLVPNTNGSYTVMVTDAHGCQGTSGPYVVTNAGITEISALAAIAVYPNPADNTLFVDFNGVTSDGKIIIRLLDVNGRVLIENTNAPVSGEKVALDLSEVQDGIYLLQINQNDATAYRKIVVNR